MKVEESEPVDERTILALHGYKLAAGLIWRDRHALLLVPLLLALPGVLRVLVANESSTLHALASFIIEGLRLLLLYILTIGLIKPHEQQPDPPTLRTLMIWGGSLWCISMLPSIALFPNGITLVISAFLCFACTLMFYFFFTPIIAGTRQFSEIMEQSLKFTTFDTLMPLRALFTPFALALFLAAIASSPLPSTSALMYHELCYGLATTLSTYCSVAFGVSYWIRYLSPPNTTARCCERIDLLEEQAPAWLCESLNFRSGLTLALLGLVFWTNSVTSIYTLSQNTSVEIARTTVEDRLITLHLKVHDIPENLRYFHPKLLALASDKRTYLAQYPARIVMNNEVYTHSQTIYSYDQSSIKDGILHLAIHFEVDRDLKGLSQLKDVYLWYATTRLLRVETDLHDQGQHDQGQQNQDQRDQGQFPSTEQPPGLTAPQVQLL